MNKTIKFDNLLNKELQDKDFAEGFARESTKLDTAVALYKAREEAGLTQEELAERAGSSQATIARIEKGDNVSFDTYWKLTRAMGKTLKIEIV